MNVNVRTTFNQSLSMNDDNGQMPNNKLDIDDADETKLSKISTVINDKNKTTILDNQQIQKASSNPNVFSRIMHSEPACRNIIKKNYLSTKTAAAYYVFFSLSLSYRCCRRILLQKKTN